MMPMTVQPTRDQLRALANAATPGAWAAEHGSDWDLDGRQVPQSSVRRADRVAITWDDHGGDVFVPADAEFIAAARTAVPALLDALDQAEVRIKHLEATAQVLVKEALDAMTARDEHRRGRVEAEARIKAVRDALSNHPRACEKHPDDDVIQCGWKSAVLDVQAALDSEQ